MSSTLVCVKYLVCVKLFNSYNKPVGCDFLPILELRKLRLRRAKAPAQGLTDGSNRGARAGAGRSNEGCLNMCSAEHSEQDALFLWVILTGCMYVVPLRWSLKGADKSGRTLHSPGSLLKVQISGHTPRGPNSGGLR